MTSIGGLIGLVAQTPAGAAIDATPAKRGVIVFALVVLGFGAVIHLCGAHLLAGADREHGDGRDRRCLWAGRGRADARAFHARAIGGANGAQRRPRSCGQCRHRGGRWWRGLALWTTGRVSPRAAVRHLRGWCGALDPGGSYRSGSGTRRRYGCSTSEKLRLENSVRVPPADDLLLERHVVPFRQCAAAATGRAETRSCKQGPRDGDDVLVHRRGTVGDAADRAFRRTQGRPMGPQAGSSYRICNPAGTGSPLYAIG